MRTCGDVFKEMYRRSVLRYHVVIAAHTALRTNDDFLDFDVLYPLAESLVDVADEFWESVRPYFTVNDESIEITCALCGSELCPMYSTLAIGSPIAAIVVSN